MRRNRDWWKSKYVLEGLTLGEFWESVRPRGEIKAVAVHFDGYKHELGTIMYNSRTRGADGEFYELCLEFRPHAWRGNHHTLKFTKFKSVCFELGQIIRFVDGGVWVNPWYGGGMIPAATRSNPFDWEIKSFLLKFKKEFNL